MSIPFNNYINILSGVIAGGVVKSRDLITRIFTDNPLVPTNSFAEFTSSDQVGAYFGKTSIEYKRSVFYFGFISKLIQSPDTLSFASWLPVSRAATFYGDPGTTANLAALNAITAGSLTLTLGVTTATVTGIDFAAAGSFAAVAAALQTLIRAAEPGVEDWSGATVTYATTVPQGACFLITGGVVGASAIALGGSPPGATAVALGLTGPNVIVSQGAASQTPDLTLAASANASNNFASFLFMFSAGGDIDDTAIGFIAMWLLTQNIQFMFLCRVTPSNATATSEILFNTPGATMELAPLAAEYPEMIPGMIMAATNYANPGSTQSYMYQQFANITPSVADESDQVAYDTLRVNYYGQTQDNGQLISFFQRGVVCGANPTPTDMNTFANEIWLKSFAGAAFISLFLQVPEVPTNSYGRGLLMGVLQEVTDAATSNGVIQVNSTPFTPEQILAVTIATGSPSAWQQVQNQGFWYNVTFSSFTGLSGNTEWQANYVLVYAKKNDIRKVEGIHALV